MRTIPFSLRFTLAFLLLAACSPPAYSANTRPLTRAALLDKIRGGWAGQMIGVAYGAKTEFRAQGKIGEWELPWTSDMIENTLHQDDLYVEMTFAKVMDTTGLNATSEQYGDAFRTSKYHLWHANAAGRRALNQGIKAPLSGHPKYNLHANDIDFQIEADFIGLMCPGLPREMNRYADRVGHVMNYGDGVYGGMFVGGMYSAAFFESDPRKIVEAGLACIPAKSQYGLLIADLLAWSAETPNDWRKVWQLVQDKWDKDDPCPSGAISAFNIDAKLNGAYIAFGLLFGGGDFEKTMEISTRCGQDSDCNPSSAAGVLGVMVGFDKIPPRFTSPIAILADKKFDFTDYSFNEIVKSTETRSLQVIRSVGGKVSETEVIVPVQKPKAAKMEQWDPGVPYKRVAAMESAWTFKGNWEVNKNQKTSRGAGNEAIVDFEGVAIGLTGALTTDGGRADVYIDGKKVSAADAYSDAATQDNSLWHTYGLKKGRHTLRLVTRDDADSRSKGKRITVTNAIIYRER
jgi:hypothetical protein